VTCQTVLSGLSTPGGDRSEEVGDDFGVLLGAEMPLAWTRTLCAPIDTSV